jgi:hypothetical protein
MEASTIRARKRLLIGVDGPPDSGKTEFAMSCPGPGLGIILDRGLDGCLDNPNPPKARNKDWAFKIISIPLPTQSVKADYKNHWHMFYEWYRKALDNVDATSVLIDGDSDSWELQRLAEFGQLTQIMPILYTQVNAARRAMYARAWDASKIVVFTNKIKKEYKAQFLPDGNPRMDNGKEVREWTGDYERQGFPDQDYLFHLQLSTMYRPESYNEKMKRTIPAAYGLKINKCKRSAEFVGQEVWSEDCNFKGLVQLVYPEVPLKDWGLTP